MNHDRIAALARRLHREWYYFRGTRATYPGDLHFWIAAEQMIKMGMLQ